MWRPTDGGTRYLPMRDRTFGAAFGPSLDQLLVTDRSGAIRLVDTRSSPPEVIAPGGLAAYVAGAENSAGGGEIKAADAQPRP